VDGEIHAIEPTARFWTVPVLMADNKEYKFDSEDVPKFVPYKEYNYTKYCIQQGNTMRTDLYVFVENSLLTEPNHRYNIMIKILSHYRVIK
jgi:hypothetical protein